MEHVEFLRIWSQFGYELNGGCSGSNDPYRFVRQILHIARRVTPIDVVVPPAAVEMMTLEIFNPRESRKLRFMEKSCRQDDKLRNEVIGSIGIDMPAEDRFVPDY